MERINYEYGLVYSYEIEAVWPHISPLIQKALEQLPRPEMSLEEIKAKCLSKELQLWVGYVEGGEIVGAATTRIDDFPTFSQCTMLQLGAKDGISFDWAQMLDSIKYWAKATAKCDQFVVYGRKGWERTLRPLGFVHHYSALILDLNDEDIHKDS